MKEERNQFMTKAQKDAIESLFGKSENRVPRHHYLMKEATGVCRPGKTRKDRALKEDKTLSEQRRQQRASTFVQYRTVAL